jgi:hypothetical protein
MLAVHHLIVRSTASGHGSTQGLVSNTLEAAARSARSISWLRNSNTDQESFA